MSPPSVVTSKYKGAQLIDFKFLEIFNLNLSSRCLGQFCVLKSKLIFILSNSELHTVK